MFFVKYTHKPTPMSTRGHEARNDIAESFTIAGRSLFLVPKKEGGQRPVTNLKAPNNFITTHNCNMEECNPSRINCIQKVG